MKKERERKNTKSTKMVELIWKCARGDCDQNCEINKDLKFQWMVIKKYSKIQRNSKRCWIDSLKCIVNKNEDVLKWIIKTHNWFQLFENLIVPHFLIKSDNHQQIYFYREPLFCLLRFNTCEESGVNHDYDDERWI